MSKDENNSMIPVTDWGKLVHAFGKDGIPTPFVKEIFLLESKVAGTSFVNDIETKTGTLEPGSVLMFQRDPKNKYDPLAIQILNEKQERIGFVPRADNEILSRLMDAGKLLFGKVKEKGTKGDWIRITIEIYMRDL